MAEEIIQDHAKVSPVCYAIFRYFNVAGLMKYEIGQMDTESTALIPKLLQSYFHPKFRSLSLELTTILLMELLFGIIFMLLI